MGMDIICTISRSILLCIIPYNASNPLAQHYLRKARKQPLISRVNRLRSLILTFDFSPNSLKTPYSKAHPQEATSPVYEQESYTDHPRLKLSTIISFSINALFPPIPADNQRETTYAEGKRTSQTVIAKNGGKGGRYIHFFC
jgi:hypothetical protein